VRVDLLAAKPHPAEKAPWDGITLQPAQLRVVSAARVALRPVAGYAKGEQRRKAAYCSQSRK